MEDIFDEKKAFQEAKKKYTLVSLKAMPRELGCTKKEWEDILFSGVKIPVFYRRRVTYYGSKLLSYYPLEIVKEIIRKAPDGD